MAQCISSIDGKWKLDLDKNNQPIMLYSGDADLTKDQNGVEVFYILDKLKMLIANTVSIINCYIPSEAGVESIR